MDGGWPPQSTSHHPGVLAEGLWSSWGTSGIRKASSFNYLLQLKKSAKTVLERHSGYNSALSENGAVPPGARGSSWEAGS